MHHWKTFYHDTKNILMVLYFILGLMKLIIEQMSNRHIFMLKHY